jgi:hypothetical protein
MRRRRLDNPDQQVHETKPPPMKDIKEMRE